MHPALKPLEFLIGSWQSVTAKGHFPTINDFSYDETVNFEEIGQPLLNFKSVSKIGGSPKHLESGFLKIIPGTDQLSFIVSHNFGICTIEEGKVDGTNITLESTEIIRSSTAKQPNVTKIKRSIRVIEGDQLEIKTDMSTTTIHELSNHLVVVYKKK